MQYVSVSIGTSPHEDLSSNLKLKSPASQQSLLMQPLLLSDFKTRGISWL